MPKEKKFKQRVRERMERTGETYTTARWNLDQADPGGVGGDGGDGGDGNIDTATAELREVLARIWADMDKRDRATDRELRQEVQATINASLERLGELGAAIHAALAAAGMEPRHRKHLTKNRKESSPSGLPGTATFYAHIHAAESLLRFVADPEAANVDPKDQTIGAEFAMKIYARRRDGHEAFHVVRTASGWSFTYFREVTTGRDGCVKGEPGTGLFELLDRESINYPADLPGYLEHLWTEAAEHGLDHAEVEEALAALAAWVSKCEAESPSGLFAHFK